MRAERTRMALACGVLVLGASIVGCSHLRAVSAPRTGSLHASDELARAAVLRALAGRHFTVEADTPGVIVATLEDASTWLRIEVTYDAGGYSIGYRESMGLDETIGDDGERRVDGRYHRWVEALAADIERLITRPDTVSWAASAAASGGGAGAPPGVPAAGTASASPPVAYPAPAPSSGYPAPAPSSGYPAPAPSSGYPAPAPSSGYPAPATSGGYAAPAPSGGYTPPATTSASPPAFTYVAPVGSGGYAVPTTTPSGRDGRARGPTHPLDEALIPGLVLLAGGWVANWSLTLAISRESEMIGFSFLPIAGPFIQLGYLEWARYERWTGLWYPVAGVLQVAAFITTLVGATARIANDERSPLAGFGRTWTLVPRVGAEEVGLSLGATF